ncbi:hypothetical protein QYF36_010663 [Acer negundo]|nr:hypothetical protein QYF36_010663 [Acer negundo]
MVSEMVFKNMVLSCGQLQNEKIKALDGSVEFPRFDEAGTRDEEARYQEVGEVLLLKSKERDKGNSNSKSSLDKGDCGQLKNEVIKALDRSGELLRYVEARTRDEKARSQEVGFRGGQSFGLCFVAVWPASHVGFVVSSYFLAAVLPLA